MALEFDWTTITFSESKENGKLRVFGKDIREFWHHMVQRQVPWAVQHPGKGFANPCGLWGDDCKYTDGGDKLVCLCMSALLQQVEGVLPRICRQPSTPLCIRYCFLLTYANIG